MLFIVPNIRADISKDLSWNLHIDDITTKINRTLRFLKRNIKTSNTRKSVNSFSAKSQTTFVVCFFFILTNYRLERRLYVKLID